MVFQIGLVPRVGPVPCGDISLHVGPLRLPGPNSFFGRVRPARATPRTAIGTRAVADALHVNDVMARGRVGFWSTGGGGYRRYGVHFGECVPFFFLKQCVHMLLGGPNPSFRVPEDVSGAFFGSVVVAALCF